MQHVTHPSCHERAEEATRETGKRCARISHARDPRDSHFLGTSRSPSEVEVNKIIFRFLPVKTEPFRQKPIIIAAFSIRNPRDKNSRRHVEPVPLPPDILRQLDIPPQLETSGRRKPTRGLRTPSLPRTAEPSRRPNTAQHPDMLVPVADASATQVRGVIAIQKHTYVDIFPCQTHSHYLPSTRTGPTIPAQSIRLPWVQRSPISSLDSPAT